MKPIFAKIKNGFICECCGKHNLYPAYVFAHYDDRMRFTCECDAHYIIISGIAWLASKSFRRTPHKHAMKVAE